MTGDEYGNNGRDGGSSLFWRERAEGQGRALGGELEKKKTTERLF